MPSAIGATTRQFSAPYLTVTEFQTAPTAVDWSTIVVGGTTQQQTAELHNVIIRASSWIDSYCNQVIGATTDTEQVRGRVKADGTIRVHPRYWPVVSVESFAYGSSPTNLTTMTDVSSIWCEEQSFVVPYAQSVASWSSAGALGFGMSYAAGVEAFLKFSYVNGYANALLAAGTLAAATSLTVSDGTGIVAGQSLRVYDGAGTENVTVDVSYIHGSTTVPLSAAMAFAHTAGVAVSALPAQIKEAAILITTAYLKVRGDNSMVMAVTNHPSQVSGSQGLPAEIALAESLLKPFRRIW